MHFQMFFSSSDGFRTQDSMTSKGRPTSDVNACAFVPIADRARLLEAKLR